MRLIPVAVAALLVLSCATPKDSYVVESRVVGAYIDATFAAPNGDWQFFFPKSEACTSILRPEAPVVYTPGGLWGRFRAPEGEAVCEPVGIGSLRRWRNSWPRREGEMAPSAHADWRIIHSDAQVHLLRGRFPLASRIGIGMAMDLVAMVANDATCTPVAQTRASLMTFHQAGTRVFQLGRCPIQAFAQPA